MYGYGYGGYGHLGLGIDVPYYKGTLPVTGHPVADNSGMCGDAFAVQQMLYDLGLYTGKIDGAFGSGTFGGLSKIAAAAGVPYPPNSFPKADVCQALITAWQAKMAPAAAPPPAAPPPGAPPPAGAPGIFHPALIQAFPGLLRVRPPLVREAAVARPPPTGAMDRMKSWWGAASTTEKIAVVGGGVLVLGAIAYLVMPKKAAANPRRRRRRRVLDCALVPIPGCKCTPPAKHRRIVARRYKRRIRKSDFALPDCFMYPVYDAQHTRAAAARFSRFGRRYPPSIQREIGRNIDRARRRFGIGEA